MSVYVTLLMSPLQFVLNYIFECLNGKSASSVSSATIASPSRTPKMTAYDLFRSLLPMRSMNCRDFPIEVEDAFCTLYKHFDMHNFGVSINKSSNTYNNTILISTEAMYEKLVSETKLNRNLKLQQSENTNLFDLAWRLDTHGNFLKSSQFKREIDTTHLEASLVLNKLSGSSDFDICITIMKFFAVDLLKQHPNTKEIFVSKFDDE